MVQNMIEERSGTVPNGTTREAAGWTPPPTQDKAHSNAATPTDVRDVHFWTTWRRPTSTAAGATIALITVH